MRLLIDWDKYKGDEYEGDSVLKEIIFFELDIFGLLFWLLNIKYWFKKMWLFLIVFSF